MITIIFAVFAVICLGFIAYLLNQKWDLEKSLKNAQEDSDFWQNEYWEIEEYYIDKLDDLQSKLAFAGKNYIEMRNKLNEEITLLKTKINDKNNSKKKARQTVESKNKRSRKLPGMRKK